MKCPEKENKETQKIGGWIVLLIGLLILPLIFVAINSNSDSSIAITDTPTVSNVTYAVSLIEKGQYEEASNKLVFEKDSDETSKILYNYAAARENEQKNEFAMVQYYLNDIDTNNYTGPLAQEIRNYKTDFETNKPKYVANLIKQSKYSEATIQLVNDIETNETAHVLYNYASAREQEINGNYNMAQSFLDEINNNYNGPLAEEIKNYKNQFLNNLATLQKEEKARRKKEGVSIGMTQEEVLESSWGKPEHINKTTTAYETWEQWVYPGYNYLYFDDGILTAIQN